MKNKILKAKGITEGNPKKLEKIVSKNESMRRESFGSSSPFSQARPASTSSPDIKSSYELASTTELKSPEEPKVALDTTQPEIEASEASGGLILNQEEQKLIMLIRTVKGGTELAPNTYEPSLIQVRIYQGKPTRVKIAFPDLTNRRPISNEPLNFLEASLVRLIRFTRFGVIVVQVEDGRPLRPLRDSFQEVALDDFEPGQWR